MIKLFKRIFKNSCTKLNTREIDRELIRKLNIIDTSDGIIRLVKVKNRYFYVKEL